MKRIGQKDLLFFNTGVDFFVMETIPKHPEFKAIIKAVKAFEKKKIVAKVVLETKYNKYDFTMLDSSSESNFNDYIADDIHRNYDSKKIMDPSSTKEAFEEHRRIMKCIKDFSKTLHKLVLEEFKDSPIIKSEQFKERWNASSLQDYIFHFLFN